jgi:hypothetical protein
MDVVKGLIYRLEKELSVSSKDKLNLFLYGYPSRFTNAYIKKLRRYLSIFKKVEIALLFDAEPCLSCESYELAVANVTKLLPNITIRCEENVLVDDSGKIAWELAHPFCISRSRWEELAYHVCGAIDVTLTQTDLTCDFTFALATNQLSCETTAALSVYQKLCEFNYKVKRTENECRIDHKILKEKHPECSITYRQYKRLMECNMSYDLIDRLLCDGAGIVWYNRTPYIKTATGEYRIGGNISFNSVLSPGRCSSALCRDSACTDPNKFYVDLLTDYGLTPTEKANIMTQILK